MTMRERRLTPLLLLVFVAFIVSSLLWAAGAYYFHEGRQAEAQRADGAEQTTQDIAGEALSLTDRIEEVCALEDGDSEREEIRGSGLCQQADETQQAIEDAPTTTPERNPQAVPIPGPRGPGPSVVQIQAAVDGAIVPALREACGGSCEGEDGTDGESIQGEPGTPGQDGDTITGPKGDTGATGDRGPTGNTGDRGAPGADAPRITFIECEGITTFTLTVGLDDGTTYDVTCGYLEPIPDPEPAE